MLEFLFPDARKFYAAFREIAASVTAAAASLEDGLSHPDRLPELSSRIQALRLETDAAARRVDLGTDRMFVPPLDREDIHILAVRLSRVADLISGTARRAVTLHVTEPREAAARLSRVLARATVEIDEAIADLEDRSGVLERCRRIKECEEEGDRIWEASTGALFAGTPDALEILRWKTLFDQLEEALDACEDVANELETITVKHA